jgi:hypothetical protein
MGLYLQSKHKQSTTAKVRKEVIMTKYEMVAKLKMVLNGNYNSADVQSVIDALNEEIRADLNKSASKSQKNLLKACKNVLKVAEKSDNPKLQGAWIVDGVQYVVDGYRIIVNRTPLALKELVLENPLEKPLDAKSFIDKNEPNYDAQMPLPTLAEIESEIKRLKADAKAHKLRDYKIVYAINFENNVYKFNAEFLRDAILATGADKTDVTRNKPNYPIMVRSADADCFLLPINANDDRTGAYLI